MNNKFKEYTIEFHSYWHVGSGLFGGTEADNLVNKDKVGLPYIPGKTLKGLLRQAATELMELDDSFVTQSFIDDVFGEKPKKEIRINDRGEEEEGFIDNERSSTTAFFSNAYLPQEIIQELDTKEGMKLKPYLYQIKSSTAIESNGVAKTHSLRQMEVTIPCVLEARIDFFPIGEKYDEYLDNTMKWLKRMGMNRNRGLGRCSFRINEKENNV